MRYATLSASRRRVRLSVSSHGSMNGAASSLCCRPSPGCACSPLRLPSSCRGRSRQSRLSEFCGSNMRKLAWLVASIWLACGQAASADIFKNVKCDADIPKALIGQRSATERVEVIEGRNRALRLKHLGADATSDELSSINWLICGKEFIMLQDRNGLVRDVIEFPPHSKKSPAYSGYCKLNGKDLPDIFEAVLNAQVAGDELP